MKRLNLSIITLAGLLFIFFTTNLFSQDTTKVRAEKQEQSRQGLLKGETKQNEVQNRNQVGEKDGTGLNGQMRTEKQVQSRQGLSKGVTAQNELQHGNRFEDKNGDGFNDNAPDHDGDGIPNGQDSDYNGAKNRAGHGKGGFIDENGDGINDNGEDWDGDGIPNGQDPDFTRPQDGSGEKNQFGKGKQNQTGSGKKGAGLRQSNNNTTQSGACDGTGPKGAKKGSGRK
jgi:hypothetical protein